MNAYRRKRIEDLQSTLTSLRDEIQVLLDEEQDAFDNMPESLQQGEKGEKAQAAIDALEEAINACDETDSALDTAKE